MRLYLDDERMATAGFVATTCVEQTRHVSVCERWLLLANGSDFAADRWCVELAAEFTDVRIVPQTSRTDPTNPGANMKATALIEQLQAAVDEHGDLEVMSGVTRSGYGEEVLSISCKTAKTLEGQDIAVLDLVLSEESLLPTPRVLLGVSDRLPIRVLLPGERLVAAQPSRTPSGEAK
jgi:hypothetical protein